ncbi:hypothetical protein JCM5353_006452 [Sporobolomyces roseus]
MPFNRFKTQSPISTSPPSASPPLERTTSSLEQDLSNTHMSPSRSNTQATTNTQSSTSSEEPNSPRSSISSRFPLSRLHAAVSRGASQSSTSSHSSSPAFTEPTTPLELAELAVSTILTIPGPSLEDLRTIYFPKLYHEAYSHRANTREHGLKELERFIIQFRGKFESVRVRFRSHIIDQDGSATMQAAAVGLTYDVIATPLHHHHKGEHRRDIEEKRSQVMAIVKIFEGRLAQTDIVLDTLPFQDGDHAHGPQLNQCSIM